MRQTVPEPEMSRAAQLIEAWLSEQVSFTSSTDCGRTSLVILAQQTPSERLAVLRTVLNRRPTLAGATQRLSLLDQLRVTVELLGDTVASGRKSEGPTAAPIPVVRDAPRRGVGAWQSIALCRAKTPGCRRARNSR